MRPVVSSWASRGGATAGEVTFRIKHLFFDRAVVKRAVDKATLAGLRKAGALIRRIAQTSMRYTNDDAGRRGGDYALRHAGEVSSRRGSRRRYSKPGEPPRAVRPHPWIRKNLFFAFNPGSQGIVVGPVGFPRGSGAPSTLEFGGRTFWRNKRRRTRRMGDGGEVRIGGRVSRTTKATIDQHGKRVLVTYAALTSGPMVERANQLNEQLYGPPGKIAFVAARPYMGPALSKAAPQIPRMWARSVKAG